MSLAWHLDDGGGATETGCVDETFSTDGSFTALVHGDERGRHGRPRHGDGQGRPDGPGDDARR